MAKPSKKATDVDLGTLWKDDLLGRRKEANFLEKFIKDRVNQSTRTHDRGSLVINFKAQWGSGKSFFLQRFAAQLRSRGHFVAELDAWRADPNIDPLVSLVGAIKSEIGEKVSASQRVRDGFEIVSKSGVPLIAKASQLFVLNAAKKILGTEMEGELAEFFAEVSEHTPLSEGQAKGLATAAGDAAFSAGQAAEVKLPHLNHFDRELKKVGKQRDAIEKFSLGITNVVNHSTNASRPKPFFIIVDELDRCRPTFAIELLERINHLFDVEGIVFIIGTDSDELEHSIRAVYGADFSSSAYLNRFFSYTYHMAEPPLDDWITYLFDKFQIDEERFLTPFQLDNRGLVARMGNAAGLRTRDYLHVFFLIQTAQDILPKNVKIDLVYLFAAAIAVFQKDSAFLDQERHETDGRNSHLYIAFQKETLRYHYHNDPQTVTITAFLNKMFGATSKPAHRVLNDGQRQSDPMSAHITSLLVNQLQSRPGKSYEREPALWSLYVERLRTAAMVELEE